MAKPRISESDLCRAAKRISTTPAEIETFLDVETKGHGFDDQDRPVILFERHWFHKFTGGQYDTSNPNISNAHAGGYNNGGSQYERFGEAFALDPQAAMKSASWGLGQVMGFNHRICGYPTVDAFVDAMKESEGKQLDASIEFIIANNLDKPLRQHLWAQFAHGYNGKDYEINNYDTKLATAFLKFSKRKINCANLSEPQPTSPATPDTPGTDTRTDNANSASEAPTDPPKPAPPADPMPTVVIPPRPSYNGKGLRQTLLDGAKSLLPANFTLQAVPDVVKQINDFPDWAKLILSKAALILLICTVGWALYHIIAWLAFLWESNEKRKIEATANTDPTKADVKVL